MFKPRYKPKHAKKKVSFFKRPGQLTRFGMGLIGVDIGFIIVAPDFPGASPLLLIEPGWSAVIIVSMFIAGWLTGSIYYARSKK